MKHFRILPLALVLCLLAASAACAERATFFAMDTVMSVSADDADAALLADCETEVNRLEALMSVTRPTSEIAALNADGHAALSDETAEVLRFALDAAEMTDGALDVTLYPVVRAWGFTTGDYRVPEDDEIAALLAHVDWRQVELQGSEASIPDGAMVDLGALAKGYASDRLAALLREGGVRSALIDLGGNICVVGAKPDGSDWHVGVRDPEDASACVGAVAVRDCAVVTSGCYERCFTAEDGTVYGHIFDPATGRPAESGLISVTIVGARGLACDALSTALYVMGVERASELLPALEGIDAILVDEAHELWITEGLRGRFTPMDGYKRAKIHWIG